MAASRDPEDVARDAWGWYKDAEQYFRRTADNSPEQMQAIAAMSAAATAGLTADQIVRAEKRR